MRNYCACFFFFNRFQATNQLLLLSSSNRIRKSGIINVRPSQRSYWVSTKSDDVEVEVEGRHDELSRAVKYRNSLKLRAMSKVTNPGPDGHLPPLVSHLLDFGFSHDQIKDMVRRYPQFAYCSLHGKIKPFMEFLVELGLPQSGIVRVIFKQPALCGASLSRNILPTMKYLESFGITKSHWAKVIHQFPPLPLCSRQKIKACVDFFAELGLSDEAMGKIVIRCPSIVGYNVESKLRPISLYLESLGISPNMLIQKAPRALGASLEANLKPVMNFFLDKGFSMDEVILMISRYGILYCLSLANNIQPKWEFFITMGYDNSQLVKFPQFFSYSLEGRIKPRFSRTVSCGVSAPNINVLAMSDVVFERMIQNKLKKMEACLDKRTTPGKDSE